MQLKDWEREHLKIGVSTTLRSKRFRGSRMTMSVKLGSETYGEPDRRRKATFPVLFGPVLRAGRAVQRSRARELDRVAGAVRSRYERPVSSDDVSRD